MCIVTRHHSVQCIVTRHHSSTFKARHGENMVNFMRNIQLNVWTCFQAHVKADVNIFVWFSEAVYLIFSFPMSSLWHTCIHKRAARMERFICWLVWRCAYVHTTWEMLIRTCNMKMNIGVGRGGQTHSPSACRCVLFTICNVEISTSTAIAFTCRKHPSNKDAHSAYSDWHTNGQPQNSFQVFLVRTYL